MNDETRQLALLYGLTQVKARSLSRFDSPEAACIMEEDPLQMTTYFNILSHDDAPLRPRFGDLIVQSSLEHYVGAAHTEREIEGDIINGITARARRRHRCSRLWHLDDDDSLSYSLNVGDYKGI